MPLYAVMDCAYAVLFDIDLRCFSTGAAAYVDAGRQIVGVYADALQVEVLGSSVVVNGDVIDGAGVEEHLIGFAGLDAVLDGSDVVVPLFCIGDDDESVGQAFANLFAFTVQVVGDAGSTLFFEYKLVIVGQDCLDGPVVFEFVFHGQTIPETGRGTVGEDVALVGIAGECAVFHGIDAEGLDA